MSTIKKYIATIKQENSDLYQKYILSKENKTQISNSVGGKNGKRESKHSEFEALEIAETMISNSLTLEEASKLFCIPTSTIYEILNKMSKDRCFCIGFLSVRYCYTCKFIPINIFEFKKNCIIFMFLCKNL